MCSKKIKQELCVKCRKCCMTILHMPNVKDPLPCPHLTDKGCSIYERRPQACRTYDGRLEREDCLWHTLSNNS